MTTSRRHPAAISILQPADKMPRLLRTAVFLSLAALAPLSVTSTDASAQIAYGQTFTAPSAPNTFLTSIGVGPTGMFGNSSNPFQVSIYRFSGTATVGASLFSQSLGPSFNGFTIIPNINLLSGGLYALLVDVSGSATIGYAADSYAGGNALVCVDGVCNPGMGALDVNGFTAQFGPAVVTPEPATWMFVATGLIAMGAVSRRRLKRQF